MGVGEGDTGPGKGREKQGWGGRGEGKAITKAREAWAHTATTTYGDLGQVTSAQRAISSPEHMLQGDFHLAEDGMYVQETGPSTAGLSQGLGVSGAPYRAEGCRGPAFWRGCFQCRGGASP